MLTGVVPASTDAISARAKKRTLRIDMLQERLGGRRANEKRGGSSLSMRGKGAHQMDFIRILTYLVLSWCLSAPPSFVFADQAIIEETGTQFARRRHCCALRSCAPLRDDKPARLRRKQESCAGPGDLKGLRRAGPEARPDEIQHEELRRGACVCA